MQQIIDSNLWNIIDNVLLTGVSQDSNGNTVLSVDIQGQGAVVTTKRNMMAVLAQSIGTVGRLARLGWPSFTPYVEQSLRRVPELDLPSHAMLGWRTDSEPSGFCAPSHIVPGADGRFVPKMTTPITLEVPQELVDLARQHQISPKELLEDFIADVCGLESPLSHPRADHFTSNGSDEAMLAQDWFERAHGDNRLTDAEMDADDERYRAMGALENALEDFIQAGGKADDLVNIAKFAAEALQARQAEAQQQ